MADPIGELEHELAAHLRAYLRAPEADRTTILKDAASAIVRLRAHFITSDGEPDWTGKSYAYRQSMGEVFSLAGIPPGDRRRVQAAVAYHVSAALRERLDDDALDRLGLRHVSFREASVEKRQRQAELLALYRGPAEAPPLRAMEQALRLVAAADAAALRALPRTDRARARKLAEAVRAESERLWRAAGGRGTMPGV